MGLLSGIWLAFPGALLRYLGLLLGGGVIGIGGAPAISGVLWNVS